MVAIIEEKKRWTASACVFAGSAPGNNPQFKEVAIDVGKYLASKKIRLVYGGGIRGLMGFTAVGYVQAGNRASQLCSVIPKALAEYNRPDTNDVINASTDTCDSRVLDVMQNPVPIEKSTAESSHVIHIVKTMEERKRIMASSTDLGFIALPGGFGTLDELAEMISWTQLAVHALPVVLVNVDDFYTPLMAWIDKAISTSFIPPLHRNFVILVSPADVKDKGGWGAAAVAAMEAWHREKDKAEKFQVSW